MAYRYQGQSWSEGEIAEMCCDSVVESTECHECGYSWRVEPDASNYKCQDCGEGRVHSPLVALGMM
jgi:predicted Zn-ribbon and HTH transcriptional regulator